MPEKIKIIYVVGDGMADRPLKELNDQTPLEHQTTPNMDELAKKGASGIVDIIGPGIRPGSDTAHLALFGYDPYRYYTGRGPFEAAGIGLQLKPEDVAFRCNFATVNDNFVIKDRRAGRIRERTDELAAAINKIQPEKDVEFIFNESTSHRAVLVFRGKHLSDKVSDIDTEPGHKIEKSKALDNSKEAKRTAKILNEFVLETHEIMKNHPVNKAREKAGKLPANIILPRGAGKTIQLKTLPEKYGLTPVCIAAMGLIKGVGRVLGMDVIHPKGATAELDTDTIAKAKAAVKALEKHDFIFVHVKGPDIASHDGDVKAKLGIISKIDDMVGVIMNGVSENTLITVLADHTSPISERTHTGDPTPLVMAGPEVRTDDVNIFNERAAAKGSIQRIRGIDIIPILMDLTGRAKKYGA